MRIISALVSGTEGFAQIVRTEDFALGNKFVYEELSLSELARTVQLLSVIVLQHVARQAESAGGRASAIRIAASNPNPGGVLWHHRPAAYAAMLPLLDAVERTPDEYETVLRLPEFHPQVRELASLLHQSSYGFMRRWASAYPDLACLVEEGSLTRIVRGLQPFFQAASRRGDAYDSTATLMKSSGKFLLKVVPVFKDLADRNGFAAEWETLMRWGDYMTGPIDNPLRVNVVYTA